MIADHFAGIEKFESDLWKIADNLRANSNLASNEYFMPIMGLIFLRHATNRFYEAKAAIEVDRAADDLLASVAGLCGQGVSARITEAWSKPLILWQPLVGGPSSGKTPGGRGEGPL